MEVLIHLQLFKKIAIFIKMHVLLCPMFWKYKYSSTQIFLYLTTELKLNSQKLAKALLFDL